MSAVAAVNSGLTFALHTQILKVYGVGCMVDSYIIGTSAPAAITSLYTGVLSNILLPHLQFKKSQKKEVVHSLVGSAIGLLALSFALTLAVALLQYQKFGDDSCNQVMLQVRLAYALSIPISTLVAVSIVARQLDGQLNAGTVVQLWPSILQVFIVTVYGSNFRIDVLAWTHLCGCLVQLLIISFKIKWLAYPPQFDSFLDVVKQIPLTAASLSLFVLVPLSDYYWASYLPTGSLTYVANCHRIIVGATGILSVGLSTIAINKLSAMQSSSEEEKNLFLNKCLLWYFISSVPVVLTVRMCPEVLVKLLFERGVFNNYNSHQMSDLLRVVIIGMLPMGLATILFKGLFADRKINSAAFISILSTLVYFLFSGFITKTFGILGLGIGYPIFWIVVSIICRFLIGSKAKLQDKLINPLILKTVMVLLSWDFLGGFYALKFGGLINQSPIVFLILVFLANCSITVFSWVIIKKYSSKVKIKV